MIFNAISSRMALMTNTVIPVEMPVPQYTKAAIPLTPPPIRWFGMRKAVQPKHMVNSARVMMT